MTVLGLTSGSFGGASVTELREHNLALILRTLIANGPMSRADISEASGLGVTALTKLTNELIERRLVSLVSDDRPSSRGRPTYPLALSHRPWRILGILCDPQQIGVVLRDLNGRGEEAATIDLPVVAGFDAYRPHLLAAIAKAVRQCRDEGTCLLAVEVAVPGAVDHAAGVVVRSVLNGWGRVDLRSEVQRALDSLGMPCALVSIDRETNYALLPEVQPRGLTEPGPRIAFLGGRQGVSGAIYGSWGLEHGANGLAGEFGHLAIDAAGRQCWCGRRGCVETHLGLAAIYSASTGVALTEAQSMIASRHPEMAAEVAALAQGHDPRTLEVLLSAAEWLARTIDVVSGVVNPEQFIVGGFLASLREYIAPPLDAWMQKAANLPSLRPLVLRFADHPEDASLRGLIQAGRLSIAANPSAAAADS